MIKAFSKNGLPLKIKAEYTRDEYYDYDQGELRCIPVEGWLVRINGVKFPRPDVWDDGRLDWTYRYTPKDTAEGKMIAVAWSFSKVKAFAPHTRLSKLHVEALFSLIYQLRVTLGGSMP